MSVFSSQTVTVASEPDGSFGLRIDVPGKSLNVLSRQVMADLAAALDALQEQPRIPVLVVRSGKKSGFLAGGDLAEFAALPSEGEARAVSAAGQALFARLAALKGPSVAVVHGPCLGGGLELALACDYRLVMDRPDTQLGLPEVELGLLPGWGGTVRLPRIVGLERALKVILSGKRLGAREALAWGLADEIAKTEEELRERFARLLFRAVAQGKRSPSWLPFRTWRQRLLEGNFIGRGLLFSGTERLLRARVPDDMPAPLEAMEAVRIGLKRGPEAGFAAEREAAARLALSPACRNLIGLFLQRESARKAIDAPATRRVGVLGAGVMDAGIAQAVALAGLEVVVREADEPALKAGLARIDALFAKGKQAGKVSADKAEKARHAIQSTLAWDGFDRADVIVEAIVEDREAKRALLREAGQRFPEAILASNTSSLTIGSLAEGMPSPQRFAGLHFFNPVHKMPLVEVAGHAGTSAQTAAKLLRLAVALGKVPVLVGDGPGFVVNRILMPYLAEGVLLVSEGLAIASVDGAMRRFGMPMGPLELLDQIGLDVAAHVARQAGDTGTAAQVFQALASKGWLGGKSGKGFYVHSGKKAAPPRRGPGPGPAAGHGSGPDGVLAAGGAPGRGPRAHGACHGGRGVEGARRGPGRRRGHRHGDGVRRRLGAAPGRAAGLCQDARRGRRARIAGTDGGPAGTALQCSGKGMIRRRGTGRERWRCTPAARAGQWCRRPSSGRPRGRVPRPPRQAGSRRGGWLPCGKPSAPCGPDGVPPRRTSRRRT